MSVGSPNEYNVILGHELRKLRLQAGFTQQDIVDRSNGELRLGNVIALENAKYNIAVRQLCSYVEVLNYKIIFEKK